MNSIKNKPPKTWLFAKFNEIQEKIVSAIKKNITTIPNEKIEEIEATWTIGKSLNWQLLWHVSEPTELHNNYIKFANLYYDFLVNKKEMRVLWKVDENWGVFYCPIYHPNKK